MRIVKYGSSGCGPCTRMSHYDEKVVRELGLDFEYVKKRTPDYNSPGNEKIKAQLERIPSPTYVLVEGTDVLGVTVGGCDKGRFRTKIEDLLKNKPTNRGNNLHNPSAGGDPNKHCTDFAETGGCKPFRWDCQPEDAIVCRPKKGKDTYQYLVSTHGCNKCADDGGGSDLTYEWEDKDGNDIDRDPITKEITFDVTPETPLGKYHFKCTAYCRDWPNSTPDKLIKEFDLIVQDCDDPEELPDPIKPGDYDCDCPPETIQLFYDQDRGIYGSTYDKEKISSIQYIDAWDNNERKLKVWLRPGGCNVDDVCECVNICSTTTAGGYTITEMETKCVPNEKENSVTLTFTGSWIEPNTGQGGSTASAQAPVWFGDHECQEGDDHNHGSKVPDCCMGKEDNFEWEDYPRDWEGCPGEKIDIRAKTRGCPIGDDSNCARDGNVSYIIYLKNDDGDWLEYDSHGGDITAPDWLQADTEYEGFCMALCEDQKNSKEGSGDDACKGPGCLEGDGYFTFKVGSCGNKPDPDPDPAPPDIEKDPCKNVKCGDCEECVDGECVSLCAGDKICVDGECANPLVEVSGQFYPNCITFQCCPDCDDEVPPFEPGDNDDCDNKPDPNPVPGTGGPAASVYLYDRLNHTYVFCCPILADVTWLLPFDAIPPIFQRYITATATVRAAAQLVNNPQLFQLLKDRENTLRMECMNYELEQGDLNYLGQPDHTAYVGYQPIQTLNR